MDDLYLNMLYLVSRYVHIVATALLLGGTLFYELIVPVAIDELKDSQKLEVFARARWAFRWIVWCCAAAILFSGAVSTHRNWHAYTGTEQFVSYDSTQPSTSPVGRYWAKEAGVWWAAHTAFSLVAIGIALALVKGRTPPRYPLLWMRINLLILLVAIFMASAARHVRLLQIEGRPAPSSPLPIVME